MKIYSDLLIKSPKCGFCRVFNLQKQSLLWNNLYWCSDTYFTHFNGDVNFQDK